MCPCLSLHRRHVVKGLIAAAIMPNVSYADEAIDAEIIGGTAKIDGQALAVTSKPRFTLTAGARGSVLKSRDQLFYLDPETEAEFYRNDNGLMGQVVIATGGILSLFGPESGKDTLIKTPNAVGAIRGTTTYFAWQKDKQRSYVCCCYGGVDVANNNGGGKDIRSSYHSAIIMPKNGGVAPAPYDAPLQHYDDDIIALEKRAGRTPRWNLPNQKINFFAPRKVPLS